MKFNINKIATYSGHKSSIYDLDIGINEGTFLSASGDGLVVEWSSPEIGIPIVKVENNIFAIEHLKDKNWLWVGENGNGVHLVDTKQKKDISFLKTFNASIFDIQSYDNRTYIANSLGFINIVDHETLKPIHHIQGSGKSARCIAFNPEKREMAVGFSDHKIRIYDLFTYMLKHELSGHTNSVFTLVYHNQKLISSGRDAQIRTWDVENNYKALTAIPAHNYAINHIIHLAGTELIASCSMDKSVKIWDDETLALLKVINKARNAGHGTSINRLWWNPENMHLYSGSDDRTISEWILF